MSLMIKKAMRYLPDLLRKFQNGRSSDRGRRGHDAPAHRRS